jgi:hypothetical protein
MNLGIAISTATTLAEQFAVEQEVPLEITRSILDKFSNEMLNFQNELMNQFKLRSMENILLKGKLSKHVLSVYFFNNAYTKLFVYFFGKLSTTLSIIIINSIQMINRLSTLILCLL